MNNAFSLVEASFEDDLDILDMLNEIGEGEHGFSNRAYNLNTFAFRNYLKKCKRDAKGLELKEGRVPQTTYWFKCGDYPLGVIKLRHKLTESLRQQGGHVGYSIRPSERGKGYGKAMLAALIEEARILGLSQLLLTVFKGNTASRRVIESNDGVLERIKDDICYYWIALHLGQANNLDSS